MVLDLGAVNEHLWKQGVTFEDMRTAPQHIKLKYSMFAFDIYSAYHHVDIYEPHAEFLGFSWKVKGCITFFKYIYCATLRTKNSLLFIS